MYYTHTATVHDGWLHDSSHTTVFRMFSNAVRERIETIAHAKMSTDSVSRRREPSAVDAPWAHQCAHATLHGLALRRGFRRLRHAKPNGASRFAITRDAFPVASRNPRQSGIWTAPPANSSLQSPSRPPLATRRGKKCRSMAGASTVRYHPIPAHHSHIVAQLAGTRTRVRSRRTVQARTEGRCSACSLRVPHPRRRACTCAAASS